MRRLWVKVCCVLIALGGCSSSTGPDNDNGGSQAGDVLASAVIGPDGGAVTSDAVSVEVPPGAFGAEVTVTISETPAQSFDDGGTPVYVLDGIPVDFSEPITVRIPSDGEAPENPVIAIGEEVFPRSGEALTVTWRMMDATVVDGMLEAAIPPIPAEPAIGKPAGTADDAAMLSLRVSRPAQYHPVVTGGGHFRIDYPRFSVTAAQAAQLGEALEYAWSTIKDMGFSYAVRTSWPVSVTVKKLADGTDGLATCSMWGDNYSYLEFNTALMSDHARMRATAIHEFFHLVQSFYDPRWAYSKAKRRSPTLWLDEATATWIEEKSADNPAAYIPGATFTGNYLASLEGAAPRSTAALEQNYGYGMSAMIDYLAGRYGEDCVLGMYERISNDYDAVAAVSTATEPYLEWWEAFMRAYVNGGIYNRPVSSFVGGKAGLFTVEDESDSLAVFAAGYADLSANVYVVKFADPELHSASTLECSVSGGMSEVSAFTYDKQGNVTFIGTGTESVTVSGIRAIGDNTGSGVLVLVTNCHAISPYESAASITLTLKVHRPADVPEFTHFMFSPQFYGLFTDSRGMSYSDIISGPPFSSSGDGSMAGNTFTAEWDRTENGIRTAGSILIIFNEDRTEVESFSGEFLREYPSSNERHTGAIAGGPVPLDSTSGESRQYVLQGTAVCGGISMMHYRGETTGSDFWRESNALDCGRSDFSSLYISME